MKTIIKTMIIGVLVCCIVSIGVMHHRYVEKKINESYMVGFEIATDKAQESFDGWIEDAVELASNETRGVHHVYTITNSDGEEVNFRIVVVD